MSDTFHEQPIPKGALIAVGSLLLLTLVLVTYSRFVAGGNSASYLAEDISEVTYRDLIFKDISGGLVHVFDANDSRIILEIAPGTENFIRGVLRGLVRERKSQQLGDEEPFRLAKAVNGHLILQDLATKREININAFGHSNVKSFAQLLYQKQNDTFQSTE